MFKLTLRSLPKRHPFFKIKNCLFSNSANVIKSQEDDIVVPNVTVSEFIFDNIKHPQKIAVECAFTGRNYTYEELRNKAINLGHNLRTFLKLNKGDVIAILLPNVPEFAIALLGAMHGSLMATTINSLSKPDEIRRQLLDCKAKAIITTCSLFPVASMSLPSPCNTSIFTIKSKRWDETPSGSINFHEFINSKGKVPLHNSSLISDDALLLYSSGTTGLPKGLIHSHNSLVANTCQLNTSWYKLIETTTDTHQDVVPAVPQLSHMYGMAVILLNSLFNNAKIITVSNFKPLTFISMLDKYHPSVVIAVPSIISLMVEHKLIERRHFDSLRCVLSTASPLTLPIQDSFLQKAPKTVQLFTGYGTTECGLTLLNKHLSQKPTSVGRITANSYLKVVSLDDSSQSLPSHCKGHLYLKGPHIMKRYLDTEQMESALTNDGWLKTGDVAYYDDDEHVYIADRLKELIKVKGYQVSPAELEQTICECPNVDEAVVIGVPHNLYGEVPRAYVTLKKRSEVDVKEIEDYVTEKLANYKSIKGGVVIVDALPKSAYGKLLRNELKLQYSQEMQKSN